MTIVGGAIGSVAAGTAEEVAARFLAFAFAMDANFIGMGIFMCCPLVMKAWASAVIVLGRFSGSACSQMIQ